MNAVLSATAVSSVANTFPRCRATSGSFSASARAIVRMVRPGLGSARSDSSGANAPSTKTSLRLSISESSAPASLARVLAAASGGPANGLASRISARKSVYFHSSTRRCGSPVAPKRSNAAARSDAAPGSLPFAACHSAASCCSAAFFIKVSSAMPIPPQPVPGTARSRSPRAPARVPCHRSSRYGLSTARARCRARCSRAGAGSA